MIVTRTSFRPWSFLVFMLLVLVGLLMGSPGLRASVPWWQQSINIESKVGTDRSIQSLDVMYPLSHSLTSLTFTDIRGRFDDDQSAEYNLGLAHRRVVPGPFGLTTSSVIGAYGFADLLSSKYNNRFWQGTVGFEYFTRGFSFRANGYLPEDTREPIGTTGLQVTTSGNQIFFQNLRNFERPLPGFDLELGRKFRFVWGQFYTRGGLFSFDDSNVPAVEGERLRAGLEIHGSTLTSELSRHTKFVLGVEWQSDDARGDQTFGLFRFRFPFGNPFTLPDPPRLDRYGQRYEPPEPRDWHQDRLTERIERDVDVVTRRTDNPDVVNTEPAVLSSTGQTLSSYALAEGNASGDGTLADPGGLDQALQRAGTDGTVFVVDRGGTITTSGVTLQDDQDLIGLREQLLVETPDGSVQQAIFMGGEKWPTIQGTSSDPILSLAPGTGGQRVANLELTGSGTAIKGDSNRNLTVQEVTISDLDGEAISLQDPSGSIQLKDMTVTSTGPALQIHGGNATTLLTNSELTSSQSAVLDLRNTTGGSIEDGDQTDWTSGDGPVGLHLENNQASVALSNLDFSNARDTGVRIVGSTGDVTLSDVTTGSSPHTGLLVDGGNGDIRFQNATLTSDGGAVVDVRGRNGGSIVADSSSQLVAKNTPVGARIINSDAAVTLWHLDATNNVDTGMAVRGGTGTIQLRTPNIDGSSYGMRVRSLAGVLTVEEGTITTSGGASALSVERSDPVVELTDVDVTGDGGSALRVHNTTGGTVTADASSSWTVLGAAPVGVDLRGNQNTVQLTDLDLEDVGDTGIHVEDHQGTLTLSDVSTGDPAPTVGLSVEGQDPKVNLTNANLDSDGGPVVQVRDVTGGTVAFDAASQLEAENARTGAEITNSDGTVVLQDFTATNGVDTGVDVKGGTGRIHLANPAVGADTYGVRIQDYKDVLTVQDGLMQTTGGTAALSVEGSDPTIQLSDVDVTGDGGSVLLVQNTTGGTVAFDAASQLEAENARTGAEITNSDGTVVLQDFTATNGVDTGVDVKGGTGTLLLSSPDIDADTYGLRTRDAGGALTIIDGAFQTSGGTSALSVEGSDPVVQLVDVDVTGDGGSTLRVMDTIGGSVTADTTSSWTVQGSASVGLDLLDNQNTVELSDLDLDAVADTGIRVLNQQGTVTLSGVQTGLTAPTVGLSVEGQDPTVDLANTDLDSDGGPVVAVHDLTGGTVAFDAASQLEAENARTGAEITNSDGTVVLQDFTATNGVDTGVDVKGGTGTVQLARPTIDADTYGLRVNDGQGTVTVVDGSVRTAGGTAAVSVEGMDPVVQLSDVDVEGDGGLALEVKGLTGGSVVADTDGELVARNTATGVEVTNNGAKLTLGNVTATDDVDTGVDVKGGTGFIQIDNPDIDAKTFGIRGRNHTSEFVVQNGTVQSTGGDTAVFMENVGTPILRNLTVDNAGSADGIVYDTVTGGTITRVQIVDSDNGIRLEDSDSIRADSVTVTAASGNAVQLLSSSDLAVRKLDLESTGGHALFSDTGTGSLTVENATLDAPNNQSNGVHIEDYSGGSVTLRDITVTEADSEGVSLKNVQDVDMSNVRVKQATDGVVIVDSNSVKGDSLTIDGATRVGIRIKTSSVFSADTATVNLTNFVVGNDNNIDTGVLLTPTGSDLDVEGLFGTVVGSSTDVLMIEDSSNQIDPIDGTIIHDSASNPCSFGPLNNTEVDNSSLILKQNPSLFSDPDKWLLTDGASPSCSTVP